MRRTRYVILSKDGKPFHAMPKKLWDEMHEADKLLIERGKTPNKYPEHDKIEIVMTTLGELLAQHTKKEAKP